MAKRTTDKHRAAWNISHEMADLLGWARHPSPEPLSPGWADAYKKNTVSVVEYALQVFEYDESACRKLKSARKLAFEFIALLANNPTLAVMPVHEWPVESYRQLFDDLSALEREFRILSNVDEQPAGKPAATTPIEKEPAGQRKRRPKPRMPKRKVEEHWLMVMNSGNRDLIEEYLTLAETKLAEKIGTSRNTLRAVEAFQQRDIALREFNRQNR